MGGRCWDWWNRVPEGVEATNAFFRAQSQEHSLQRIATAGRNEVRQQPPSMKTYTELMNCISYQYVIILLSISWCFVQVLSWIILIYRWFIFFQHSSVSIGLAVWPCDLWSYDMISSHCLLSSRCWNSPHQDWGGGSRPAGGHIFLNSMMQKKNRESCCPGCSFCWSYFLKVKLMPVCGYVNGKHHFYWKITVGWCTPKTIVYPQNGAVVEDLIFYLLTLDLGNWFYRITLQVTEPGSMFRPKF